MFVLITPKVLKSRSAVAKRQMQPESSKCDTVYIIYIHVHLQNDLGDGLSGLH